MRPHLALVYTLPQKIEVLSNSVLFFVLFLRAYIASIYFDPLPQNLLVAGYFVFVYMSCTKCIYFQEVYFRT